MKIAGAVVFFQPYIGKLICDILPPESESAFVSGPAARPVPGRKKYRKKRKIRPKGNPLKDKKTS